MAAATAPLRATHTRASPPLSNTTTTPHHHNRATRARFQVAGGRGTGKGPAASPALRAESLGWYTAAGVWIAGRPTLLWRLALKSRAGWGGAAVHSGGAAAQQRMASSLPTHETMQRPLEVLPLLLSLAGSVAERVGAVLERLSMPLCLGLSDALLLAAPRSPEVLARGALRSTDKHIFS